MKRYFSSFMGMKESEKGEWVEYSLYLSEMRLLEEIAKTRLNTIQERNEEIIILKQELDILENDRQYYKNANFILENLINEKDNHKPNNLYLDLFSTSLTFNILFLMTIVYCFIK
jgi:hypothetical protein